jgi:hypothetical protein
MHKKSKILVDNVESRLRCLEIQITTLSAYHEAWVAVGPGFSRKPIADLITDRLALVASVAGEVEDALDDLADATGRISLLVTLNLAATCEKRLASLQVGDTTNAKTAISHIRTAAFRFRPCPLRRAA